MELRDLHPVERPAARLEQLGAEALSDADLLAVVTNARDLDPLAGIVRDVASGAANYKTLAQLKGIGARKAAAIIAAVELGRRLSGKSDGRPVLDKPARVLAIIPWAVRTGAKEHFIAFYLNARSQMLYWETVSIGTLSASLVHPREVFAPAISHSAAALIVAHNHPSGDCTPSPEDRDATRRLSRSGELLGIPLLDHLIVAERGYFSFKEQGLLC